MTTGGGRHVDGQTAGVQTAKDFRKPRHGAAADGHRTVPSLAADGYPYCTALLLGKHDRVKSF